MRIFENRDCLPAMKEFPDKHFNLAIVDVPYGLQRHKKGNGRYLNKYGLKETGIEWDIKPTPEYFNELFRISKQQIIWGANNFDMPPTEYFIIWNKEQTVDNFATCEYAWTNCKVPAKMFNYSIHLHNHTEKIHPTQKPIPLYKWLLKNYAKEGDLILDTHVGSASSLIAFEDMGFDYVGYELDADYYKAAVKRINQYRAQQDLFKEKESLIL